MPKTYIVGNWKMNQSIEEIESFIKGFAMSNVENGRHWIAPQFVHIPLCVALAEKTHLKIGAQNASENSFGAFTGEICTRSIKEVGGHFVILGHSERRQFQKESNQLLQKKIIKSMEAGLRVIYCIGETLEEREAGKTMSVVKSQLLEGLADIKISSEDDLVIAYEPVWAIGTGKTATPFEAEEVHAYIRGLLLEKFPKFGTNMSILYGGSVKPNNIRDLLSQPNINGALVGGASLKAEDFIQLCRAS
jgi:triosephosphate isomerase